MKKEIFFGRICGQDMAITIEDGKISDIDVEGDDNRNMVGSIYKGRVTNVLSGMQAAFVNCGLEKNCYLSTDEIPFGGESACEEAGKDGEKERAGKASVSPELKAGDEIMVQITKPPRDNKGAKVTTKISYVGRTLIYSPHDAFIGVSHKIEDEELRNNLVFTMEKMCGKEGGVIVRTAAPLVDRKALKRELDWLRNIDRDVRERFKKAKVGDLLYMDGNLFSRTLRDSFNEKISNVYVADDYHFTVVKEILSLRNDGSEKKLVYYRGARDMMVEYGLLDQMLSVLKPKVPLDCGGNIVVEKTEAMNVIDVNTGKFVGKENLEDTVFMTNLEAAREIARQVRLRNLGGITVVDFIDMTNEDHKRTVAATLEEALSHDKAKCHVLPISDFCVVEFTRKRTNRDFLMNEARLCPHCGGSGYVLSDSFISIKIRADISDLIADGYEAVVVELNRGIMESILSNRWFTPFINGKWRGKRVYMIPHRTYFEEYYTVRGDNSGVLHLPDDAVLAY